jgi:hypothetical protein
MCIQGYLRSSLFKVISRQKARGVHEVQFGSYSFVEAHDSYDTCRTSPATASTPPLVYPEIVLDQRTAGMGI